MICLTMSAFAQLVIVTIRALSLRKRQFVVIHGQQLVDSIETTHAKSMTECGTLCTKSDVYCSASYDDGICLLSSICNPRMMSHVYASVIRRPFPEDCKADDRGLTYKGTINTTISNRTCQAWALDVPHSHDYNSEDNNYCRGLDNEYPGPWCYTTDPGYRWEFCAVYKCGTECDMGFFLCKNGQCILDYWRCNGEADCSEGEDESSCNEECLQDEQGFTYRGKMNVTKSGLTCQKWSSKSPHSHPLLLGTKNYCQSTGFGDTKPWCYTTIANPPWEYCEIPMCN